MMVRGLLPPRSNQHYRPLYLEQFDARSRFSSLASSYSSRYTGAEILDPHGAMIGVWYSHMKWGYFAFPGDKVVIPYPPAHSAGWESTINDKND
jgi:hypothetical protein